jgi:hypothetical protein
MRACRGKPPDAAQRFRVFAARDRRGGTSGKSGKSLPSVATPAFIRGIPADPELKQPCGRHATRLIVLAMMSTIFA